MVTRKKTPAAKPRTYVLDTNVLMHDPSSIYRFQEHDVVIPFIVLEELDNNKKGHSEISRNARTVCKSIDAIFSGDSSNVDDGIPLKGPSGGIATGRLFVQGENGSAPKKPDNQILDAALKLAERHKGRQIVLVSKDTLVRVKGRARGVVVEDYHNDQVIEDTDLLYSGSRILQPDFWDKNGKDMDSGTKDGHTFYHINGPQCRELLVNQFVYQENDGENPFYAVVATQDGSNATMRTLTDYTNSKNAIWGITARNREQNFVLNLLMNPEIDFITLLGHAGTGKTLLTLAAGLMQVLEGKLYSEIIITRVTVPVGEDIGFLPGTEEEKMSPWMGALDDNLDVLNEPKQDGGEWGRAATRDLIRSRIKIKSLNFMRGRTFLRKYLIIDEAQNLTPKQMKTLITRAGPGTKVVCMGNIAQIDTPYLTEGSSGLAYAVDRFKGWEHSGHITLLAGERSRLSSKANEVL